MVPPGAGSWVTRPLTFFTPSLIFRECSISATMQPFLVSRSTCPTKNKHGKRVSEIPNTFWKVWTDFFNSDLFSPGSFAARAGSRIWLPRRLRARDLTRKMLFKLFKTTWKARKRFSHLGFNRESAAAHQKRSHGREDRAFQFRVQNVTLLANNGTELYECCLKDQTRGYGKQISRFFDFEKLNFFLFAETITNRLRMKSWP